ncbi:MAG: DUF418 domain-containing protein [Planctomycetota bacterium]
MGDKGDRGRGDPERYRYLDVLRGVAVFGILPVNIAFFGLPAAEAQDGPDAGGFLECLVEHGTEALCHYRFLSIFAFLFGIGIVIIRERCASRGLPFGEVMVRRLIALLTFGALHVLLLWYGDILFFYALAGLVLFSCSGCKPRTLWTAGAILVLLPILLFGVAVAAPELVVAAGAEHVGVCEEALREEMTGAATGSTEQFLAALPERHPAFETAVFRDGSFARQIVLRLVMWGMHLALLGLFLGSWIAGLMLIGMASAKSRWILRPEQHRGRFLRLTRWGLGVGLPLQCSGTWLRLQAELSARMELLGELFRFSASLGIAAAYVGLLGLLCARRQLPAWTTRVAAVGRTALSNYILQSLLCTILFYPWGFGLFGSLDRRALLGVVIAVWILELAITSLWLGFFHTGPLEGLWRWMTYGPRAESARGH